MPLIGGYAVPSLNWRWTQWILLFFAAASILFALGMQETHKKVLLARRAKKRGVPGPDGGFAMPAAQKLKLLLTSTLFRPWRMFFTEIIVGTFAFYIGLNFGIYYLLFAAVPYVFITVYDFGFGGQGLAFLGLAVGNVVAFVLVVMLSRLVKRKMVKAIKAGRAGKPAPEKRLTLALIGSVFVPIGLFWFGWSARRSVHWIVPIIGLSVFAFGNFLIFVSCISLLMNQELTTFFADGIWPLCHRRIWPICRCFCDGDSSHASQSAGWRVSVVRNPKSVTRSLKLYVHDLRQAISVREVRNRRATSLLAFIVLLLTPLPWLFYKFGPAIRAKSHYIQTT